MDVEPALMQETTVTGSVANEPFSPEEQEMRMRAEIYESVERVYGHAKHESSRRLRREDEFMQNGRPALNSLPRAVVTESHHQAIGGGGGEAIGTVADLMQKHSLALKVRWQTTPAELCAMPLENLSVSIGQLLTYGGPNSLQRLLAPKFSGPEIKPEDYAFDKAFLTSLQFVAPRNTGEVQVGVSTTLYQPNDAQARSIVETYGYFLVLSIEPGSDGTEPCAEDNGETRLDSIRVVHRPFSGKKGTRETIYHHSGPMLFGLTPPPPLTEPAELGVFTSRRLLENDVQPYLFDIGVVRVQDGAFYALPKRHVMGANIQRMINNGECPPDTVMEMNTTERGLYEHAFWLVTPEIMSQLRSAMARDIFLLDGRRLNLLERGVSLVPPISATPTWTEYFASEQYHRSRSTTTEGAGEIDMNRSFEVSFTILVSYVVFPTHVDQNRPLMCAMDVSMMARTYAPVLPPDADSSGQTAPDEVSLPTLQPSSAGVSKRRHQ